VQFLHIAGTLQTGKVVTDGLFKSRAQRTPNGKSNGARMAFEVVDPIEMVIHQGAASSPDACVGRQHFLHLNAASSWPATVAHEHGNRADRANDERRRAEDRDDDAQGFDDGALQQVLERTRGCRILDGRIENDVQSDVEKETEHWLCPIAKSDREAMKP